MKRLLLIALLLVLVVSCIAWGEDKPLYLDAKATPEQRTEDLLARMTLREKLGQMTQIEIHRMMKGFWSKGPLDPVWMQKVIVDYGAGSILSGGDGAPDTNSPEEWVKMTNQVQEWTLKSRLKIPVLYGIDAVHGHNNVIGATIYPYHMGLAASFNPDLAKEYASLTAEEVAATGIQWTFAPVLDVAVDPRWGRTLETYGEDPYLVTVMGSHEIQGFESSGKIIACAKHFTGYSAPDDGHDRHPATISEREFREIHFPPYIAAVKANVGSVMVNSGAINGTPAHASQWLLTDVLRKEMGFKGLVVTDWQDVEKLVTYHHAASTMDQALALSYNAGIDLNMVPMDITVVDKLEKLVQDGKIPMTRVDDAVRHILLVKFRLGLFEKRTADPATAEKIIGSEQSRKVARTAALQSMTLLRNENNLLPISKKVKSLLVAGISANSLTRLCGGWTIHWIGADDSELSGKTVLQAIKQKVSGAKVTYLPNANNAGSFIKAAKEAEAVVVVVGEAPYAEEHGDSPDLRVSRDEEKIIETLQKAKIPFALVVAAGRPIILPGAEQAAPAILWAFQPGTEGGPAIADVLFGDYNPSGRLPISFPRSAGKPRVAYYHANGKGDVIYPFGYGLSYTEFACTDLQAPASVKVGQTVKVAVKVKNAGKMAGDHIVLAFLNGKKAADLPLFEKQLVGFARVSLAPGEEKTVTFEIKPEQLSYWDKNFKFVEKPCKLQLEVEGKTSELSISE